MLTIIKQLHKEYVGTSPSGQSVESLPPIAIAQEVTRALGKSLGISSPDRIKVRLHNHCKPLEFGFSAQGGNVLISAWMLIDEKEYLDKFPSMVNLKDFHNYNSDPKSAARWLVKNINKNEYQLFANW